MDYVNDLDLVLQEIMAGWDIPGMAVGIVDGDEIVYAKGFGVQSLKTQTPVTLDLVFCIQSVSKCFVATAVMHMVEREPWIWIRRLSITCPIFKWTMNVTGRSPSAKCSATPPGCRIWTSSNI